MCVIIWDNAVEDAVVQVAKQHSEFVSGIDFRLFRPGMVASCGWDRSLWVWDFTKGTPR